MTVLSRRSLVSLLALPALARQFTFGVLADVQYGDLEPGPRRDYRGSLDKLRAAVAAMNAARPSFVIQLGDLIDRGAGNLDRILPVWNSLKVPRYSVLGNHDLYLTRATLKERLQMPAGFYAFSRPGWRFLVLDAMDVAVKGRATDTAREKLADRQLDLLRRHKAPNANDWNGAVSEEQKTWLRKQIAEAAARRQRVIVFSHIPVLAESTTPAHLLWNAAEIVEILDRAPQVVAFMCGHDHAGGYARRAAGTHYVTFPGMVESGARNSWTLVEVHPDRLELRGHGTAPTRTLAFAR